MLESKRILSSLLGSRKIRSSLYWKNTCEKNVYFWKTILMTFFTCHKLFTYIKLHYETDNLTFFQFRSKQLQETGWIPQHIVARDECENILGVIPLYLKRFSNCYTVHMTCLYRILYTSPSSCNLISAVLFFFVLDLQPFIWWVCFWSFLGGRLLQIWFEILPKVTMLCTVHSSDRSENFNP